MSTKLFFACALAILSALTLTAQSGTTAEGIKYTILEPGTGPNIKIGQEVNVQAEVVDSTGKVVWSSRDLGFNMHFRLDEERAPTPIDKAREALILLMKKGSKYREEAPFSLLPAEDPESKKTGYIVSIVEITDVMDAKPRATDLFVATAEKSGIPAAEAEFKALQQNNPKGYTFFEWDINMVGYEAMLTKKLDVAIALFTLNTMLYPNSANTYDSLGNALAEKGDKEKAKANYQKAFQMNPNFTGSKEKMDKL
jgi:hypothetical protein